MVKTSNGRRSVGSSTPSKPRSQSVTKTPLSRSSSDMSESDESLDGAEGRTPSANRCGLVVYRKLTHIDGELATIKAEQERKNVQHAQLMVQLTETFNQYKEGLKSAFMKEEIKRSSELSQYKTELKAQKAQIDKLDKRVMLMAEENTRIASKLNCNQTFGLVTFIAVVLILVQGNFTSLTHCFHFLVSGAGHGITFVMSNAALLPGALVEQIYRFSDYLLSSLASFLTIAAYAFKSAAEFIGGVKLVPYTVGVDVVGNAGGLAVGADAVGDLLGLADGLPVGVDGGELSVGIE